MEHSNFEILLAGGIFVAVYTMIIFDVIDKTIAAVLGASLMIVFKIFNQEAAFKEIDLNTLGLLISMMVIIMITKRSGVFEYLAIKTVKIARGEPLKIIFILSVVTGLISALLDNVTTILLIIPVTFDVAKQLHINPIPFIISEVFASNIGGTATLVGDPPNIMIGSAVPFNFMDFIYNEAVIIIPMLLLTSYIFTLIYKNKLATSKEAKDKVMLLDENKCIKDSKLLIKSGVVLTLIVIGFIFHGMLHYDSATVAMIGAAILLLISGMRPDKILEEVEWKTIFFFVGLFIMVGGIKEVGIIKMLAQGTIDLTHGNQLMLMLTILWVSAIASAFIDNIPFVATMIPLIKDLGALTGVSLNPLWWALSLGACLGGNGTIIGASANVVATGMAEEYGHKISFKDYFKIAFPVMLITIVISTIYLYLRFYL